MKRKISCIVVLGLLVGRVSAMQTRKPSDANDEERTSFYEEIIAQRKAERAQREAQQDNRSPEEKLIDDIKREVAAYNTAVTVIEGATGQAHLQQIADLLVTPLSMRLLDQDSQTYITFISGDTIPGEVKEQVMYLIKLDDPRLSAIWHIPETLKERLFMRLLIWKDDNQGEAAWHHGWGRRMLSTLSQSQKTKIKKAFPKKSKR